MARKDGFFDEQRQKHLFRFDVTNWINEEYSKNVQLTKSRFGGIGAISVYFYKAEEDEKLNNLIKGKVHKVKVPESTGVGMGIKISTGFEKCQDIKMASYKRLKSTLTIPVAVLHIHYRPTRWLRMRNILFDDISIKIEKGIEGRFEDIKIEKGIKREFSETEEESKQEIKKKKIKIEHEYDGIKMEKPNVKKNLLKENMKLDKNCWKNNLKQYKTLSVAKQDIDLVLLRQRKLERENRAAKNKILLTLKR
jgi:hypothetical protein